MLEELNNILDRTNNWIVFEEARNSGLIAINLGLISFIFGSGLLLKEISLILCVISIMISAYSFIGKKIPVFSKVKVNKGKDDRNEGLSEIEEIQEKNDSVFSHSRVVIRRNNEDKLEKKDSYKEDLYKYETKNIYSYKDVAEMNEEVLLLLVYNRLLKRNEKEEYPIHINKEYHFKLAHKDLSEMIYRNSGICLVKSKCFFISLTLFMVNIVCMGISFLI
ncbi:hypothetical protein [Marinisporobacter balticus]|uniref:Uncharacterized protein n=1 Tax=Marinisporobacter balticus TaxID=2018667 RepID=A0A4R2KU88_9FIRM|nr:hypothetical protein [Marinisporobacter balticus]TCO77971.1 hypothetical protein EV214_10567 [Marinisporobacter balticus]